eukprot:TRINITY_DN62980_c0_g1_i1.p3 TRINITY_DN62980_c0_g1~~TRINITY_DN62980_c0_g1_i1.p3  ORF type:complete len:106 (+),score=2.60 TRINITY_DN62980_c0_g1_i1:440-757(+)
MPFLVHRQAPMSEGPPDTLPKSRTWACGGSIAATKQAGGWISPDMASACIFQRRLVPRLTTSVALIAGFTRSCSTVHARPGPMPCHGDGRQTHDHCVIVENFQLR